MANKKKAKKKAAKKKVAAKKPEDLSPDELTDVALEEADSGDESSPQSNVKAERPPPPGVPPVEYITVRGAGIGCKRMTRPEYEAWKKKQAKK